MKWEQQLRYVTDSAEFPDEAIFPANRLVFVGGTWGEDEMNGKLRQDWVLSRRHLACLYILWYPSNLIVTLIYYIIWHVYIIIYIYYYIYYIIIIYCLLSIYLSCIGWDINIVIQKTDCEVKST